MEVASQRRLWSFLDRRKRELMDNVDKYSVSQYSVKSLLGYIDAGDIAISEI